MDKEALEFSSGLAFSHQQDEEEKDDPASFR